MRVRARVCARRMCVKSHPFQLPGSRAERGTRGGLPSWLARRRIVSCAGCKSALIWALQPLAQLLGGPKILSELSEEGELLKARPEPARA